jgi:ribosomal protein S27AE
MDLVDLFWNLRQQQQIGEVNAKAALARSDVQTQDAAVADLNRRFERLALVTQALAELLSERAKVSQADLAAKIDEIDMRDGVRDGRVAATRSCPKCGRAIAGHRTTCLYCGATLDAAKPFDGL